MREIPERYRLDNLLFMGRVNCRTIDRLAEILIRFHIRTRTSKEIQQYGQPKFINEKINKNFNTLAKLVKVGWKLQRVLLSLSTTTKISFYIEFIKAKFMIYMVTYT